jgi:hypothetical protein
MDFDLDIAAVEELPHFGREEPAKLNLEQTIAFCHWLPVSLRNTYAAAFRRKDRQEGNLFLTPGRLNLAFRDFRRLSRFLQFPSYGGYLNASQFLLPSLRRERLFHHLKSAYFQCAAGAGSRSVYFLPNLASVFSRISG